MDIDTDSTLEVGYTTDSDDDATGLNPEAVPDALLPSLAIVKYNGILARRSIARHRRKSNIPFCRINAGLDLPEGVPPMPKEIKKLMYNGIPIGSRLMHNAWTGEYFKFNGLKDRTAKRIGEYLLCIPVDERKDIIERMLLCCQVTQIKKMIDEYQNAARNLVHKNRNKIQLGRPIVCDQLGVIH